MERPPSLFIWGKAMPKDQSTTFSDALLIMRGGPIKALDSNGRIGGYLVVWGSPQQRDLQGEYFTQATDLKLNWYGGKRPALYHHGLDDAVKADEIGEIDVLKADDTGVWAEAQLNMHNRYVRAVQRLVDKGALGWSSGSMPNLVQVDKDGHIKVWPIAEGSMTPSPAEPRNTGIRSLKAVKSAADGLTLKELAAKAGFDLDALNAEPDDARKDVILQISEEPPEEDSNEETTTMDIQSIIAAVLQAVIGAGVQLSQEQQSAIVQQVMGQMQQGSGDAATMSAPITDEAKAAEVTAAVQPLVIKAVQDELAKLQKLQAAVKGAIKGVDAEAFKALAGAGGQSQVAPVQSPTRRTPDIQVRTKYARLSAEDLSYIYFARNQVSMKEHGAPWQPEAEFMGELYTKAQKGLESGDLHFDEPEQESRALTHIKAALKSNELDTSTQSGYGDEWVPDLWSSQLWDRIRLDNLIAPLFQVIEMPSNPFEVPLESTDPTVYFVPETSDETQLTLASSSSPIPDSKFGTGKVQLNAKKLALRAGYPMELEEDSIIPIAAQSRKQAVRAIENAIDSLLLNGDDSASGNINLDGGTPAATALYMAFEGLRHVPIIDTTANAVDMGGVDPTLAKIRQARFTLAAPKAGRPNELYYVTHTEVLAKLLGLAEFITVDKYGPNATVMTGELGKLDGAPVIVTAELGLTASNGKISNTGGNNTLGSLLVGHKGSRIIGYKRRVTPKLVYLEYYDAYQLVVTTRIAFGKQDADSEALLYNIKVS